MKYVITVLLLLMLIYELSFAKFNWTNKKYLASIGSALLGLAAFGLTFYIFFFTDIEL